jgi:lactoylglutathione lyase
MLRRVVLRSLSTARHGEALPQFKVLGLQQLAIGNTSRDELRTLWVDLLGLPQPVHSFKSEKENVDEDVLELGEGAEKVEIDLMQPIDPSKSPKVHIPPLNHFGIWIDDLEACVENLKQKGVRFTPGGIRKGASGYNVTFIHPKGSQNEPFGSCGVLVELVQAPPEVIEKLK